jgi:cytochrome c oxidase assembly protein subunit 15
MPAFRKLLFLALFLTFDLIMFGAFVRVTDAGLGCPDWPGCYGKVTPLGALDTIRAEAAERPHGPVTEFKAWVEMLHRYVAAGLGLMVIALAVMATRLRRLRLAEARIDASHGRRPPPDSGARMPGAGARMAPAEPAAGGPSRPVPVPDGGRGPLQATPSAPPGVALAWFTLAWIILQGIFGAWTVTLKLKPLVVTGHLLGGMILFGLLLAQAVRVAGHPPVAREAAGYARWAAIALALLFVQITLGGWVSTNYATLACRDFPACQGALWPDMDFAAGFELWRRLGVSGDGSALPFQALTAIHYTHRLGAYVVFAVVGLLAWRIRRIGGLERVGELLLAVLTLQLVTGLTNIFLDWPLIAAVLHTGGAAALLGVLLVVNFRARAAASQPPAPVDATRVSPLSGPTARAGA